MKKLDFIMMPCYFVCPLCKNRENIKRYKKMNQKCEKPLVIESLSDEPIIVNGIDAYNFFHKRLNEPNQR